MKPKTITELKIEMLDIYVILLVVGLVGLCASMFYLISQERYIEATNGCAREHSKCWGKE